MSNGHWNRASKLLLKAGWTALSHLAGRRVEEVLLPDSLQPSEWIRRCRGAHFIEPEWGYIVSKQGHLLEDSMSPNDDFYQESWKIGMPSINRFLAIRSTKTAPLVRVPRVIHLRHWWEWNFYHFHMDVLGRLEMLERHGIGKDVPIVVGRYASELPFARQILKTGNFANRTWIVQDDSWVEADEIIYCRTRSTLGDRAKWIHEQMGSPWRQNRERRVLLARPPGSTRSAHNHDAVVELVSEFGFELIDTNGLSIEEQMRIFANVRYLIAMHGAGMTNILHRAGSRMDLLEVYPSGSKGHDEFERIAQSLGFNYRKILCETFGEHGRIHDRQIVVDIENLRSAVMEMLGGKNSEDTLQGALEDTTRAAA